MLSSSTAGFCYVVHNALETSLIIFSHVRINLVQMQCTRIKNRNPWRCCFQLWRRRGASIMENTRYSVNYKRINSLQSNISYRMKYSTLTQRRLCCSRNNQKQYTREEATCVRGASSTLYAHSLYSYLCTQTCDALNLIPEAVLGLPHNFFFIFIFKLIIIVNHQLQLRIRTQRQFKSA